MKAIVYKKYGPPEALELIDMPVPSPDEDEVLIKISYAGVNPIDWKIGEGRMKAIRAYDFPLLVGRDVAGVIEHVGSRVTRFSPGNKVFAALPGPGGAFAEFVAAPASYVAKAPDGISLKESASLPLVALTCWQSLIENAGLARAQKVFILSGAGGTGSLAVQIARARGAIVLTTCSPKNRAYVESLGARKVYDYANDDVAGEIRRDFPDGVDVVFSNVLGGLHEKSYGVLKRGGVLVTIGEPPIPALAEQNDAREIDLVVTPNGEQLTEISHMVDNGNLEPPVVTEVSLDECAKAFRMSMDGHVRGKIVLRVR